MTAEVRTDSGKFVRTAWRVPHAARDWWGVIGYDGVVQTVYEAGAHKAGLGPEIVRSSALYEFVERVNRELMALEALVERVKRSEPERPSRPAARQIPRDTTTVRTRRTYGEDATVLRRWRSRRVE